MRFNAALASILLATAIAPCAIADGTGAGAPPWSWNAVAALATRDVSRGLDLTNGPLSPSFSGEVRHHGDWYADAAVTAIDYFDIKSEIDASVGHRGSLGQLRYDLGINYYEYPGTAGARTHASFGEGGAHLMWGNAAIVPVADLYLSPNYFFGSGFGQYIDAGADAALPGAVTLSVRYGYTHVRDLVAFQYPDYRNWIVSALRSFGHWDLSMQLTDTSMDRKECLGDTRCSLKFALRIARNFGQ